MLPGYGARHTEIFSAYYDDRENPSIVVLGLQNQANAGDDSVHFYCVFKYENNSNECVEEQAIIDVKGH